MRSKIDDDVLGCECEEVHCDRVEHSKALMPELTTLYELADFFKVLGDSTRVSILFALEGGDLCVCDIAAALGLTKSAVSHQLKGLRIANLVKYRRDGQNVYYSLADGHVRSIIEIGLEHLHE